MAVTTRAYPEGEKAFRSGGVDWVNDDIKMALVGAGFSYDPADQVWDDISADEYDGATGYTSGGEAISSRSVALTLSGDVSSWQGETAYAVGDIVRASADNGAVFRCVVAGTSGQSEPTWPDFLREVEDGTAVWVNVGGSVTSLVGDQVQWSGLDQTATKGAVIYLDSGDPSSSTLLAYIDFGTSENPTSLTITPPADGYIRGLAGGA